MKILIITFSILILSSCENEPKQQSTDLNSSTKRHQSNVATNTTQKKVGQDLFASILDTVKIEPLSIGLLIKNDWVFTPIENCKSYLKFQENGKGISYNCELEEDFEIMYIIDDNRLKVSEYGIPHVDNPDYQKIKIRDDMYVYNGFSLIMVNSKMYNITGKERTPQIEVVIGFNRNNN